MAIEAIPGAEGQTGTGDLRKGSLRTIDAVAMAIAVLSPAMAMAYNTSGSAAFSGTSTPLAFLIGGIGCLALAFVVIGFTRRMASAGYAYTYSSRTLGKRVGFLTGWMYFFGFFCFVPMTMSGVGGFTGNLIQTEIWHGMPSWFWFPIFLVGMAALVILAYRGIRLSTRALLWVGMITVAVIVILDIILTAKGGKFGQSLQPFTFGHTLQGGFSGIFYGLIFGVTSFIGFETAAVLGEETRNPRRAIPISVLVAVVFAIVFYVWTTYNIAIGVGVNTAGSTAWATNPAILATLAKTYVGTPMMIIVDLAAIGSAFIVCLACATAATRTLFAMGREGVLPQWLGRTHPVTRTPTNAILVLAGAATVSAFVSGILWNLGPANNYFFYASVGTIAVCLVYVVLCVGGSVYFRRISQRYNLLVHGAIPVIGIVVFGLAVYGSVYSGAIPPAPYTYVPYVNLGWLVLGIVFVIYLSRTAPEKVGQIGSILGEEGGETAAILDQPSAAPAGG
ncbi:MAG TPA: APC family permease [Candidatus Micrarchaeaceae archaeon]|nr:APC family permease [Candidatus Micrarchaeaceae archaeon]